MGQTNEMILGLQIELSEMLLVYSRMRDAGFLAKARTRRGQVNIQRYTFAFSTSLLKSILSMLRSLCHRGPQ